MYFGKNELNSFFQRSWPGALVVFSLSLLFSRWFWPTLTFTDPDSFYHVKMTELMAGGLVRDFSWLPFTSLAEHFADHHFLYHVLLFPFIKFFGPFVGLKIATVFFAAGALTTFYLVMRALRLRAPFLFTLILMTSASFVFRMHLAKAPALSLILVLLEIFAIVKSRPRLLGILSFIHVWTHGSWPLPLVFSLVWAVGQRIFVKKFITPSLSPPYPKGEKFVDVSPPYDKGGLGGVKAAVLGVLAGLIVNPYFPQNLAFYWTQIVQIAVLNIQTTVSVGAEWYPSGAKELFTSNGLIVLTFLAALVVFVFHAARTTPSASPSLEGENAATFTPSNSPSPEAIPAGCYGASKEGENLITTFGLVLLAVLAALMTVKSRRHLDYSAPLILMAAASLITLASGSLEVIKNWLVHPKLAIKIYSFMTVAVLVAAVYLSALAHRNALNDGHRPHELSGALSYLEAQAPAGSIVFHTEWDDFPMLLYGAPHLRYIAGLDPLFFARHDLDRYKIWTQLSRAEWSGDPALAIQEHFGAGYIFARKTDEALLGRLRFSKLVRLIYERDDLLIYVLLDS